MGVNKVVNMKPERYHSKMKFILKYIEDLLLVFGLIEHLYSN